MYDHITETEKTPLEQSTGVYYGSVHDFSEYMIFLFDY